jgi:hypothetical protein
MIVITIELHDANTEEITELGSAKIWNTGEGTQDVGLYKAQFDGKTTERFSHPRKEHVWDLLYRALKCKEV